MCKKFFLVVNLFTFNCFSIEVNDFAIKLTEPQTPYYFREKLQSVDN